MNKKLPLVFSTIVLVLLISLFSQNAFTSSGGAPAGLTGSPGDGGLTCNFSGCHTGMATTPIAGWITSNVPATGYVPGQTYTITATATQAGCVRFGFQISPQSVSGTYLGTLVVTNSTTTQIVGTKYIEQKAAGTTGSTGFHTWTFDWIAPATGIGTVTFYGSFNCSNNNNGSSGDHIYTSTLDIPQCAASTVITANGPTTFCSGGSVTLDAGNGFSAYLWSNSATSQTINATSSGIYSVTVTNSGGCQAVALSQNIIVNSLPSIPVITPNGATTFCQGNSVILTATGGLTSYLWSNGASSQSINVSSTGNYFVSVTNANGCSIGSAAALVTVNALPTPTITGSSTICAGSSSVLDAGGGYTLYSWSNGSTNQTVNISTAGTYTVTVTNSNGCTGENSIITNLGSALTPTISASGSNSICQGSSITLDAGSGFNTYNWSDGSTNQMITVNTADSFFVDVSDVSGCTGVSNTVVTTIADTPVTNASIFPNPVCNGESVFANASGDTSWIYEWNPGGIFGKSVTLSPTVSTTYTLTVSNSNNCSTSFLVSVDVLPLPLLPAISQSGGNLIAIATGVNAYQWTFNAIEINGATNSIYNAGSQYGTYTVRVYDSLGCMNESAIFNYSDNGITLLNNSSFINFPNPFAEFISIENLLGENEIELLNLEGEIVFKKSVSSKNEMINTELFPSGFYLLKVISKNQMSNRVVVKH